MNVRFTITYSPVEKTTLEGGIAGIHSINSTKVIHLTLKERHDKRKMGPKGEGYVSIVMNGAIAHSEIVPSTYNMGTMYLNDRDIRLYLVDKKDKLLAEVEGIDNTIMELGCNMINDADFFADIFINAAKHDQNLQSIVDAIVEYRQKNPTPNAHISVPMNGSVLEEGYKKGTRVTNWGTTILTMIKTGFTTGGIQIGPNDSHVIPDDWASTTISNGSSTAAGEFSM